MKKKLLVKKVKRHSLKNQEVWFSGFCFTDNKNFAFFDVTEQFAVDNGFNDVLSFKLSEDDLQMIIDRKTQLVPSKSVLKVTFDGYGTVDKRYYNMFIKLNPSCKFYPVTEWFESQTNRLIVGLPDREGKPIGVLKTC